MKRHGLISGVLASCLLASGVAFAAEGANTGNGTSTEAGPASNTNRNAGGNNQDTGKSATNPPKAGNQGSQGEATGTSTYGGPANK